jgi:formylglycine-generating enzyme required for sulfatase activity
LGTHKIKAKAFDKSSNVATSLEITVIINEKPDTTAPVVTITSPADYEDYLEGDIIDIKANATDSSGILKVDFWVNGEYYLTDNDYPYECVWNSTGNFGYNVIYANAYDIYGNASSSNAINVQIKVRPVITITSPNGSEIFQMGRSVNITWEDNFTENVKIELFKGNISVLNIAGSETSDGLFIWNIPRTLEIASDYSIKISNILDGNFSDMSDTNFQLSEAVYITLLQPDGGEKLEAGSLCQILWQDNLAENVEIELYKGAAFYSTIASSVESNGSFTWNVSSSIDYDSDYQIHISSTIDPAITGVSEANFSIFEPNFIRIISPNGGEDWVMGSTQTITWEDNIDGNVTIRLFKRDEQISEITNSTESDGLYSWTIQSTLNEGYGYSISIFNAADSSKSDSSDLYFSIPNITTPQGMVFVQGGTFEMGDRLGDGETDEIPVHSVTVSDFYIGRYEITQSEWKVYMPLPYFEYDYGIGDNYPIYNESWYDVIVYCNKRSIGEDLTPCYSINGSTDPNNWGSIPTSQNAVWDAAECNWNVDGYRLPTEAEWEYACRGGIYNSNNYRYSGGEIIDEIGWYFENSGGSTGKTFPVGLKKPNQLGIYDMSGNVREWCWDWFWSSYYTICNDIGTVTDPLGYTSVSLHRSHRGGYWLESAYRQRVTDRNGNIPQSEGSLFGFRIIKR